jgi:hypothetical protein
MHLPGCDDQFPHSLVATEPNSPDPLPLATELVERAGDAGVCLRIIGGLAVRALCPSAPQRPVDGQDLDLGSRSAVASEVAEFLAGEGFEADSRFNAIHGGRQLRFGGGDPPLHVDVMLDRLMMSHELEFGERLGRLPHTIDATDLLLSKLQVVELNAKDLHDIASLLASLPVREGDQPETIGLERFGGVVRGDWGWWRTATRNLERLAEGDAGPEVDLAAWAAECPFDAVAQARRLREFADEVPKTRRWKLRAKVGERKRWYELPEEVEEV